jgi:hypothetical protein
LKRSRCGSPRTGDSANCSEIRRHLSGSPNGQPSFSAPYHLQAQDSHQVTSPCRLHHRLDQANNAAGHVCREGVDHPLRRCMVPCGVRRSCSHYFTHRGQAQICSTSQLYFGVRQMHQQCSRVQGPYYKNVTNHHSEAKGDSRSQSPVEPAEAGLAHCFVPLSLHTRVCGQSSHSFCCFG